MAALIEGKVARILSDNIVIINVGTAAGVKPGMPFVVLAQGEEVADPETGKPLGRWETPKGHLRVTHAQERMATCEGFDPTRPVETGDPRSNVLSAAMIAHSMRPETWRAAVTNLNVNRSEVAGMPTIGPISVGDVVREMPTLGAAPQAKQDEKKAQ